MVVDPKVLGKVNLVEANIYYTSVCCAFRMFWPFLRAFVVECECLLLDTRYGGHFTRRSFFSPIIASKKKRIIRLKQLWKWINQQIRPCSGALRHLGEKKGRIKRLEKALEKKIMTIKRTINKEWSMSTTLRMYRRYRSQLIRALRLGNWRRIGYLRLYSDTPSSLILHRPSNLPFLPMRYRSSVT